MDARIATRKANRKAATVAMVLVVGASLFNLVAYHTELTVQAPDLNDHVYHLGLTARIEQVWERGGNPRDPWIPYWGQGFPVLRYYQHLPHLTVVALHRLLQGSVPLWMVFKGFNLALLVLLPWAFFQGARWLGLGRLTAALVALCTPLLAADLSQRHYLGLHPQTFSWLGGGLFTQLAAAVLFPLALGGLQRAVLRGRRYGPALALLSATWLSHLLLGYATALLGGLAVLRPEARGRRLRVLLRLAGLYAATAAVASYLIAPTLLESGLLWRSVYEDQAYWDSYGAKAVISALVGGGLLDGERLPVLTVLAGIGVVAGGWRAWRRDERSGPLIFALLAMAAGLALYFGRPTWGSMLSVLPFSRNLPFHRFLCAVQLAGLLLAGIGLSEVWRAVRWDRSGARMVLALGLTGAALAPAVVYTWERARLLSQLRREAAERMASSEEHVEPLMTALGEMNRRRPGRGYAGTSWDWGQRYARANAPVYMYWTPHDIPAISYMFHSMGLNSELDVEFDAGRRDHYDLFNVRYLLAPSTELIPTFASVFAVRPGVYAASVETRGYFDFVGADRFLSMTGVPRARLHRFNQDFIASDWHGQGRFVRIGWREDDASTAEEREWRGWDDPGWTRPDGEIIASGGYHDRFRASVRASEAGYVLFRMTFHPDWRARVDGRPVATAMLSPSYVGIPVEEGEHEVEVEYVPGAWTTVLFWVGLCVLGLSFLGDRARIWPSAAKEGRTRTARLLVEAGAVVMLVWLFIWVTA